MNIIDYPPAYFRFGCVGAWVLTCVNVRGSFSRKDGQLE